MDINQTYKKLSDRWKVIKKTKNNRSVTRLAKESIMQFPLVFSDNLPIEKAHIIVKGLESMLAAQVAIHLSTHNDIDLEEYDGIGGYLQKFTNTNAIPDTLNYSQNALSVIGVESVTMVSEPPVGVFEPSAVLECLLDAEDVVNKKSINDLYQPYKETVRVLESAIVKHHEQRVALEASFEDRLDKYVQNAMKSSDFNNKANINAAVSQKNQYLAGLRSDMVPDIKYNRQTYSYDTVKKMVTTGFDVDGTTKLADSEIKLLKRKLQYADDEYEKALKGAKYKEAATKVVSVPGSGTAKVSYPKEAFLEPTMVECEFLLHGNKEGRVLQKASFGVKVMPRVIPTGSMINNLATTLTSSNSVFQFIKWRTGEQKFAKDLVLGLNSAKADAKAMKSADKVFASLRSLRRRSKIGNFTGKAIPVTTTFIITSLEAEMIRQQTGYDLYDEQNASIILDKLHCLGFGIYNTETERLDILFDAYSDYMSMTLASMNKALKAEGAQMLAEVTKMMAISSKR